MPDITSGIQTALSSLLANAQEINIVEHNVANVNTPGYHKQVGILGTLQPKSPYGSAPGRAGQQGQGVTIDTIQRYSNNYLDARYRAATADTSDWDARSQVLGQLETTLAETSDSGLTAQLNQFFTGWASLANDPTSTTARTTLMDHTTALTDAFNTRSQQLTQLRSDQNTSISGQVDQINSAASQVADLNKQIASVTALGQQPNDLMDKRDQLLDSLAGAAGAVSIPQADGSTLVSIGGHVLVSAGGSIPLQTSPDPTKPDMLQVTWKDGQTLDAPSGSLKGLFYARDQVIPAQLDGLNQLAAQLAASVNTKHRAGFAPNGANNLDFFDSTNLTAGNEAATLKLNPTLKAADIATAGVTGQPGNSDVATAIGDLGTLPLMNGATTLTDFINNQVTALATDVQRAQTNSSRNNAIQQALTTQRSSENGVSLDEEAANLTKYQRAYEAAARLMTTYDSLLSTIIHGMGTGT
jgi:flagellar hook-associated protein 1 FlgK